MAYAYTPTYYSTLHDSITSLCKTILPFSFKKRRLPAAEHRLSKLQSDNLKWQQDSFHQILNLMGLHQEGILAETEVSAFRTHLLETLIASPLEQEHPVILRDKLVFLQELLYAKCISEDEYHSSKRPLLQRLAVQGAEIEARDVIVGSSKDEKEDTEEEWSVIDLRDEQNLTSKEAMQSKDNKSKPNSAIKQIRGGAASVFGFASSQSSSHKQSRRREEKGIFEIQVKKNPESENRSILMQESCPMGNTPSVDRDKARRKPFRTLFQRDQKEGQGGGGGDNKLDCDQERGSKLAKKQWGFDGFKKWKRNGSEDETAPLPLNSERSDSEAYNSRSSCHLVDSPMGEGPNTKQIKKKLHSDGSPSDFFIDKVLGDKIKKELSRIQTELCTSNPNFKFSDDQIEAISTKLPVEKADLKQFFPKSWCDRYGDVVLDVVKKEFKDHVGEMENLRNAAREKYRNNSMRWTTFDDDGADADADDDENCQPNLFANRDHHSFRKTQDFTASGNPFLYDHSKNSRNKHRPAAVSASFQNPFWT